MTLVFHLDPTLHPTAAKRFEETAAWALPYFNGFFTRLKTAATLHVIVPLSSSWCGTEVAQFDYGNPTAAATASSYLCGQDGGANAGHGDSPNTAFVVVRPPESEVTDFKTGSGASTKNFFYSLLAAEMGHASRGLMMESYTGELSGQRYWPIWAQYLSNELMRYAADMRAGVDAKIARADRIWWMCPRKATWKADYGDPRLVSWESGIGGIYGCPTDDPTDDAPNHYNMAFIAAEYLVAKHGLDWLLQNFMVAPVKARNGDGSRNLEGAAKTLGYATWREIEEELNSNLVAVLRTYNAELP